MTAWIVVTVVWKSLTSALIETFITDWSSTMRNCAVARATSASQPLRPLAVVHFPPLIRAWIGSADLPASPFSESPSDDPSVVEAERYSAATVLLGNCHAWPLTAGLRGVTHRRSGRSLVWHRRRS